MLLLLLFHWFTCFRNTKIQITYVDIKTILGPLYVK